MLHLLLFASTITSDIREQQRAVVVMLQATPKSTLQRSDWICGELLWVIWLVVFPSSMQYIAIIQFFIAHLHSCISVACCTCATYQQQLSMAAMVCCCCCRCCIGAIKLGLIRIHSQPFSNISNNNNKTKNKNKVTTTTALKVNHTSV